MMKLLIFYILLLSTNPNKSYTSHSETVLLTGIINSLWATVEFYV